MKEKFPIRYGTSAFLADRKLFAKGFLYDVAPLYFLPTGNYSQRVSYPMWHHCVSCQQETIRKGFPIRCGTIVFLANRKLFAKGFLSDMAPLCFLPTGNYSRMVSYPAWLHSVSFQQETIRERFPTRCGTSVFLANRKLFAYSFLSGIAPLCFISIGNYSRMVSCPA